MRPRGKMVQIAAAEELTTDRPIHFVYHDPEAAEVRVRFSGATLVATSFHHRSNTTAASIRLLIPGQYTVTARKEYGEVPKVSACQVDTFTSCFKSCNPNGPWTYSGPEGNHTYGGPEGNHAFAEAQEYDRCMASCSRRCDAPILLREEVPVSPSVVTVRGSVGSSPLLLRRPGCVGSAALGPGVWINKTSWSGRPLYDPDTLRALPALGGGEFVWQPLACWLPRWERAYKPTIVLVGDSRARELSAVLFNALEARKKAGHDQDGLVRMGSSADKHWSGPNSSDTFTVTSRCGLSSPTTLSIQPCVLACSGEGASQNGPSYAESCSLAARQMAASRLPFIYQRLPTSSPYPRGPDENGPAASKYHGARGWLGVDRLLQREMAAALDAYAAAGANLNGVLDEYTMSEPFWDLRGDSLHLSFHMPEESQFLIANVARVLWSSTKRPGRSAQERVAHAAPSEGTAR